MNRFNELVDAGCAVEADFERGVALRFNTAWPEDSARAWVEDMFSLLLEYMRQHFPIRGNGANGKHWRLLTRLRNTNSLVPVAKTVVRGNDLNLACVMGRSWQFRRIYLGKMFSLYMCELIIHCF